MPAETDERKEGLVANSPVLHCNLFSAGTAGELTLVGILRVYRHSLSTTPFESRISSSVCRLSFSSVAPVEVVNSSYWLYQWFEELYRRIFHLLDLRYIQSSNLRSYRKAKY